MDSFVFIMLYLGLGVICGLVCFAIAVSKARDGWGWFFLGLFFGPIAVLVAAAVGPGQLAEPNSDAPEVSPARSGVADELTKLADLLERGHITSSEFETQKTKLLA